MSSYAAIEDLQIRLGNKFGQIYTDADVAGTDLAESSAELNGYLSKRYVVPVTDQASVVLLRSWELDLAVERAYLRCGGSEIPEKYKTRAAAVRSSLRDVARGMMQLPAGAPENRTTAGGSVTVVGNEPLFTRDSMGGF